MLGLERRAREAPCRHRALRPAGGTGEVRPGVVELTEPAEHLADLGQQVGPGRVVPPLALAAFGLGDVEAHALEVAGERGGVGSNPGRVRDRELITPAAPQPEGVGECGDGGVGIAEGDVHLAEEGGQHRPLAILGIQPVDGERVGC